MGQLNNNSNSTLLKIAHREPLISYIDKLKRLSYNPVWYPMAQTFFKNSKEEDLEVVASIYGYNFKMQDNDVFKELNSIKEDKTKTFFIWSQPAYVLEYYFDYYITSECPFPIMFVSTSCRNEFILKKSDLDKLLAKKPHGLRGQVASKKFNF